MKESQQIVAIQRVGVGYRVVCFFLLEKRVLEVFFLASFVFDVPTTKKKPARAS